MMKITKLAGREILDSRGRPTVEATCVLADGSAASASVPSGASTGSAEALEVRDGDASRYRGLGCRQAAMHVGTVIGEAICGNTYENQAALDRALVDLQASHTSAPLGANSLLAVSLAFARASAASRGVPLYRHFANMLGEKPRRLPRLTVNLFSGGKHAGGQVPIQDVLIVPMSAATIDESLSTTFAIYQAAAEFTREKYGTRALTADEGGLAPPFTSLHEMFSDAVAAIRAAGYTPGHDVALAVDVASSHFYRDGQYYLDDKPLSSLQMIDTLDEWVNKYPIVSVEDGLAEDDWQHWPILLQRISHRALVLGDDLLCTNPARIRRAIETSAANALLLKVNQIGTLSAAALSLQLARQAGWHVTISARSGETEDNWLADLAVGWSGDHIKVGSITQSERLAKYNRLLAIEAETKLRIE
jgi:enolase